MRKSQRFILFLIVLLLSFPFWGALVLNQLWNIKIFKIQKELTFEVVSMNFNTIHLRNIFFKSSQMECEMEEVSLAFSLGSLIKNHKLEELSAHGFAIKMGSSAKAPFDSVAKNKSAVVADEVVGAFLKLNVPIEVDSIRVSDGLLSTMTGWSIAMIKLQGSLYREAISLDLKTSVNDIYFESKINLKEGDLTITSCAPAIGTALKVNVQSKGDHFMGDGDLRATSFGENVMAFKAEGTLMDGQLTVRYNKADTSSENWSLVWKNGEPYQILSNDHEVMKINEVNQAISGVIESKSHDVSKGLKVQKSSLLWELRPIQNSWIGAVEYHAQLKLLDSNQVSDLKMTLKKSSLNSSWNFKAAMDCLEWSRIKFRDIGLSFPLQRSFETGTLSSNVFLDRIGEVQIKSEIAFREEGLMLAGNVRVKQIEGGLFPIKGLLRTNFKANEIPFSFHCFVEKHELGMFTDDFGLFEGHLSLTCDANVQFAFDLQHGWSESLKLSWSEGFFSNESMSHRINGLKGSIETDQVLRMNTGPAQEFGWEECFVQGLTFSKGKVFWQWEKEQQLFIESLTMHWCQGELSLLPLRLKPDLKELEVTFFCEGLQLADMLETFQLGEVEGRGELGGKISFSVKDDHWSFNKTYLFSDPEVKGTLLLKEARGLDATMGASKLALARECLKDYSYQWAKLNFVSEGDSLVLKLNMDGKPNRLLPFRFEPKTAEFIYDESSPGVDLKGLKLNVNFRSKQILPWLESSFKWLEKMEF